MNYTNISKYMSMVLRHKPETIGITLDEYGWADVDALVQGIAKDYDFNRAILEEIVRTDSKQRYSFNEDGTKIRANQGHSIAVDLELEPMEPPQILWHGTAEKSVASIDKVGVEPMSRMYVHLSLNRETAVKVGSRHGNPVVYKVKAGEMYQNGYQFYRSVNGVWLTKLVPPMFLERI